MGVVHWVGAAVAIWEVVLSLPAAILVGKWLRSRSGCYPAPSPRSSARAC